MLLLPLLPLPVRAPSQASKMDGFRIDRRPRKALLRSLSSPAGAFFADRSLIGCRARAVCVRLASAYTTDNRPIENPPFCFPKRHYRAHLHETKPLNA